MTERAAYRVKEFAEAIGVDRVTVWRWIKKGKLPTVVIGGMTLIPACLLAHSQERHPAPPGATSGNQFLVDDLGRIRKMSRRSTS